MKLLATRIMLAMVSCGVCAVGNAAENEAAAHMATYAQAVPIKNVIVCKEAGRFGGWPANNGAWSWGNEIVVGFVLGHFKAKARGHAIDDAKPAELRFARSLDGGETWAIEPSTLPQGDPKDCPGGIEFTHPDFAMTLRMVSSQEGYSRFYWSADRCKTWQGPYALPSFGRKGIAARTDYLVNGPHDLIAFITSSKNNGREGRPFCTRTTDGGKTWDFVSWIGPEPKGYAIMPSTVRLSPTRLLTAIRVKKGWSSWIDAYASTNNGKSWEYLNRPAPSTGEGNPPSMIRLEDGRLALTYGYRAEPFGGKNGDRGRVASGIYARLSLDNGCTWGDEIILRDDGGCWDLGYPRTVQRGDGKVVTVYYFNDAPDEERYIAATVWDPGIRLPAKHDAHKWRDVKPEMPADAVERINKTYPLSDQANHGHWVKFDTMTDEFLGDSIDTNKWWDHNPTWRGRQPGLFYPGNVAVRDGKLHLTMKKEDVPEMPDGYHTYTCAAVKSKTTVLYGYFEVKAIPMPSAGSSSFWFYDSIEDWWTEIDVFELTGNAERWDKRVNMNAHVFHTPVEKRHWSCGGGYIAPRKLVEDYHVYGLEWTPESIKFYFDGALVREGPNTHWHQPLTLNFDSETMPEWFGLPNDEDLPSTFSVEYVRTWKQKR